MSEVDDDDSILQDFIDESKELYSELEDIIEEIEDSETYPIEELEKFAQIIDRVMGTADTLHMTEPELPFVDTIAIIGKLCKKIGYNAKNYQDPKLIPIYASFWADCLEILEPLTLNIATPDKIGDKTKRFAQTLQKRLEWLLEKVKNQPAPEESGESEGETEGNISQNDIDALLNSFDL